jgi:UDP-N-acetyl-D-glucosamine dehydrogenase
MLEDEASGAAIAASPLDVTTDMERLAEVDVAVICVPTPLNKQGDPALDAVVSAAEAIAAALHPGELVILESTTYPGTTEEVLLPRLERTGLAVGEDFFLAFAPERIDPGNKEFTLAQIPRIVGGVTPACRDVACALYSQLVEKVVPVSSARTAEMAKLLENTFRNVNIALVNELAQLCRQWGIDMWEVVSAAATKPFGFMPFYPGPGVGGHCIPVDPVYLAWRARQFGMESRFIELARYINAGMPRYVVQRIMEALNEQGKPLKSSRVLVLGVAYKPNVSDTRESPSLEIIQELRQRGAIVEYCDPYIPSITLGSATLESVSFSGVRLASADCVVVVTNHSDFDWDMVGREAQLVVDTRNALRGRDTTRVVRL